jgi:LAO/AO transport system kinase
MNVPSEKKMWLLAEKLYQLIQKKRMKNIDKEMLIEIITKNYKKENFNLYKIANDF